MATIEERSKQIVQLTHQLHSQEEALRALMEDIEGTRRQLIQLRLEQAAVTEALCAQAWGKPGSYEVTYDKCAVGSAMPGIAVEETVHQGSKELHTLPKGTVVDVVEIVERQDTQRLRGRIVDPPGWISMESLKTNGRIWVQPHILKGVALGDGGLQFGTYMDSYKALGRRFEISKTESPRDSQNITPYGFTDSKERLFKSEQISALALRMALVSIPGGDAYAALKGAFCDWGCEDFFATIWAPGKCHETVSAETGPLDHPFEPNLCPNDKSKACWQCGYIFSVRKLVALGVPLAVVTSNVCEEDWVEKHGAGFSELQSEGFKRQKPHGWGTSDGLCLTFTGQFGLVVGSRDHTAPVHPDTGKPLGVGCRWERCFLDSLPVPVKVFHRP